LSWTLGVTRCELRLTKETMEEFLQKNGGTMVGDTSYGGTASIIDALINGTNTKMTEGQIIGVPLRGADGDSSNELSVPGDGSRATAGGALIRTAADAGLNYLPVGSIIMWYAALGGLPTGWQECDGTNGSPDLRENFPRGVGGAITLGGTGGATTATGNTGSSGGHTPSGTAAGHALTEAEMPVHNHRLWGSGNGGVADATGLSSVTARTVAGWITGTDSYTDEDIIGSQKWVEDTGSGDAHEHTVAFDAVPDHTHTLASIATVPPYVGVYFIMKVS